MVRVVFVAPPRTFHSPEVTWIMDNDNHIKLGRFTKDLTGKQFGDLTVIRFAGKRERDQRTMWECLCACGKTTVTTGLKLTTGHTKSCGCLYRKHGKTDSPEYNIWHGLKKRCSEENGVGWKRYGGRGIFVCERWANDFRAFLEDMGQRPSSELSIDRIDNDKGYECGKCPDCLSRGTVKLNCRWATATQQIRNRSNTLFITHEGVTLTLMEWSERTGKPYQILWHRLYKGWSVADALTVPVKKVSSSPK
jgi:hypothetical protein